MIHIIILSHFICLTIGCILFYELIRNVKLKGKHKYLVIGTAISNIMFLLDTFNIYFRHWYADYSLDGILGVICMILFAVSAAYLLIYFILVGKQKISSHKKANIIGGSIFSICLILQIISNIFKDLTAVPWGCIGYIIYCGIQIKYLFMKKEEENKNLEILTEREAEIAKLVSEGKSNKEIAEELFISQNTVRNHIYNIYKKVGVKNKVELINKLKH